MDTFSHALWGKALFGYKGARYSPFLFGAAPDLFSFIPYTLFKLFGSTNAKLFGKPVIEEMPSWVFNLYDLGHSFVTFLVVISVLVILKKKVLAFASLSWAFHILLDFPFHTKEFFPTKIFWPINDFIYDGVSWANPQVWFMNLFFLCLFFFYRFKPGKDSKS